MLALSIIWNRTGSLKTFSMCLKNVFHVPRFAAGKLLLRLASLNSTESEIDLKSFSFWAG